MIIDVHKTRVAAALAGTERVIHQSLEAFAAAYRTVYFPNTLPAAKDQGFGFEQ